MAANLKWKGNGLFLGKTMMAETQETPKGAQWRHAHAKWSKLYETMADARQDCVLDVQRLLRGASVEAVHG